MPRRRARGPLPGRGACRERPGAASFPLPAVCSWGNRGSSGCVSPSPSASAPVRWPFLFLSPPPRGCASAPSCHEGSSTGLCCQSGPPLGAGCGPRDRGNPGRPPSLPRAACLPLRGLSVPRRRVHPARATAVTVARSPRRRPGGTTRAFLLLLL